MKNVSLVLIIASVSLLLAVVTSPAERPSDAFSAIKDRLSQAACVEFEFLSMVEMDVFDVTDSAWGRAQIARDGRFYITVGGETYLYDAQYVYTYSQANNQLVIEPAPQNGSVGREISFVTQLDDLYETTTVETNNLYRLIKRDSVAAGGDIPDSMEVGISADKQKLAVLRFYDINEDVNTIRVIEQITYDSCNSAMFTPDFPDSVETVRL